MPVHDHQAFLAQPRQRLPDRAPADRELGGQLVLDEALPGLEPAHHDGVPQGVHHLVGEHPARSGTQPCAVRTGAHRRLPTLVTFA